MICHDLKCDLCGKTMMNCVIHSVEDISNLLPCSCGGRFQIFWTKPPGVVGTETGATWFKKGYNVQLGKTFEDYDQHQRYVKSKGLQMMGPDEWKRNQIRAQSDPEPKFDEEGLRRTMEESWHEVMHKGKRLDHPVLDTSKNAMLDAGKEK